MRKYSILESVSVILAGVGLAGIVLGYCVDNKIQRITGICSLGAGITMDGIYFFYHRNKK